MNMIMSKCEGYEEVTSLLIRMRNYYLLVDFWTRTSPKYTNLVQTRHTTHWDLARNPRFQCAGGLTVGVENGYDEVNVQIPEEEKNVEEFFDKYTFEIDSSLRKTSAEETRIIRQELEKDRYASTKRVLRSVATQRPNWSQSSVTA
ncbi:hypothetical protein DY000_02008530 [Brassica cretica]|uniref:Uncharacterized protein n=1 Tax=Brassica cretica TaxID=69181 RepID=A0ABQ7BZ47_BRACR|nr:hypothetical protein DY000_02008530 [Brassica cretica]